jgi:hypothetical protein
MSVLPKLLPRDDAQRRADIKRQLMRREAEIGGKIFGPLTKGHRRQFFCLDAHSWVWHEEWKDAQGKVHSVNTRYEVRPDGILKSQNGHAYQRINAAEAQNLHQAAEIYLQKVSTDYHQAFGV